MKSEFTENMSLGSENKELSLKKNKAYITVTEQTH